MKSRIGQINRKTRETQVSVTVNLDGNGKISVKTEISFLDHLITSLGKHSMLHLKSNAIPKDGITHHLIEDVAIALASPMDSPLGNRSGIVSLAKAPSPMDVTLAEASP